MNRAVLSLFVVAVFLTLSGTKAQSPARPAIVFTTIEQGRERLKSRDDFVARLSPFDRSARLKTDKDVSERDYLQFVGESVLAWTSDEKAVVEYAWAALAPKLEEMSLPFPETVYFIKTTGAEEGGQEYTRGKEIVLPTSALTAASQASLKATIAHELFHILSRNAPELRERLYAVIGFQPCGEIPFPPALASRKLTDPDAPRIDHCIRLLANQGSVWAVPLLFSKMARYDVAEGGTFFQSAELQFLIVRRANTSPSSAASYDVANPELLDMDHVHGFYEQVGRNTKYIIHPEEILADNFRLLLLGKADVPSPEILQRLAAAMRSAQTRK
jgi:hypothetical protein